jgi:hypothetical protein
LERQCLAEDLIVLLRLFLDGFGAVLGLRFLAGFLAGLKTLG